MKIITLNNIAFVLQVIAVLLLFFYPGCSFGK